MITIVVPALNEERYLYPSVKNIILASKSAGEIPLDIVIINDGSTDRTAEIIKRLEDEYSFVRSIHHQENKGIGYSFLEAVEVAKYEKISIFPADDYSTEKLVTNLFKNINSADLVISYTLNTEARSRLRNMLSTLFSLIYMLTFNIHIKYINGSAIYPTKLLRTLKPHSRRYSLFAEINVRLLRMGITYLETEGEMNPKAVNSSALKIKNLLDVITTYIYLVFDMFLLNRKKYNHQAIRVRAQ